VTSNNLALTESRDWRNYTGDTYVHEATWKKASKPPLIRTTRTSLVRPNVGREKELSHIVTVCEQRIPSGACKGCTVPSSRLMGTPTKSGLCPFSTALGLVLPRRVNRECIIRRRVQLLIHRGAGEVRELLERQSPRGQPCNSALTLESRL